MGHRRPHDPLERINAHRLEELDAIARAFGGVADVRGGAGRGGGRRGHRHRRRVAKRPDDGKGPLPRARERLPSGVRVAFVRLARRARSVLEASEATGGTRP